MLSKMALLAASMLVIGQPASAADASVGFLTKLFIEVCVPNLGQPARIRAWAEEHHLTAVSNPTALDVFVGDGDKGAAWAVPASSGSFALSIRGTTEACAVWARAADPGEVQSNFIQVMEGIKRPGIVVSVDQDQKSQTPSGEAHSLVYNVTAPGAVHSFVFTLLTAERSGGAFQASMQAAEAGPHP